MLDPWPADQLVPLLYFVVIHFFISCLYCFLLLIKQNKLFYINISPWNLYKDRNRCTKDLPQCWKAKMSQKRLCLQVMIHTHSLYVRWGTFESSNALLSDRKGIFRPYKWWFSSLLCREGGTATSSTCLTRASPSTLVPWVPDNCLIKSTL